ncbi:MAG: discoidin domain-containing protein [Myxococcales bacterium]|nr:discoidin domain-containing protein [Myxococcales bacterium]
MKPTLGPRWWLLALVACGSSQAPSPSPGVVAPPSAVAAAQVLDAFDDLTPWRSAASDGVQAAVQRAEGPRGPALRLRFDLSGTSGYAVARRALPLSLPEDFELVFQLRGELPRNNFEFKLTDASGENVWWFHRRDYELSPAWRTVRIRRSQIEFAWGPTADRTLREIAAIELVVSAGQGGGAGWIEVDELTLRPRAAAGPAIAPRAHARWGGGGEADATADDPSLAAVLDGQPDTAWRAPAQAAAAPLEITIDLGRERDLVGVLVQWATPWAQAYELEVSLDGERFTPAGQVRGGNGGLDVLPLGDTTARHLRLRLPAGSATGVALAEVTAVEAEPSGRTEPLLAAAAARAPRGTFPRAYLGEQPYWTVVGVDGGHTSGLLSEDGALELWPGGPSLEPVVTEQGQPVATWAQVRAEQTLVDGYLPIPVVTWRHRDWELQITALAVGDAGQADLAVRYTLRNLGATPLRAQLALALRPLQVNPPTQSPNIPDGVSALREVAWSAADAALLVDGRPALRPLSAPAQVSLYPLHALGPPAAPVVGAATSSWVERDPSSLASAALAYPIALAPGQQQELVLVAPWPRGRAGAGAGAGVELALPPPPSGGDGADAAEAAAWFASALAVMRVSWHAKLDRVGLRAPAAATPILHTLRSSLAYLLVSRDGAMLRPGTRSYARAWIRDGAMISEALLRLGHPAVAAEFLRWFAPHQFASGKVPCCVDAHGAGPVPEHDSHGQLAFLAREVYRYTKDRASLREVWPRVLAAMRYQRELRHSERTSANTSPQRRALWGLLPPSISHEGYSAKPAYSYWDDFWGLRGLADAAALAAELGDPSAAELAAERDLFTRELRDSLLASTSSFGLDVIPGAAELGDFDPTSTTIALAPGVPAAALPPALVTATFERAWRELAGRIDGSRSWTEYTPYELRLPGAFVRLGWRERAHAALAFYLRGRRPAGWNQWPEVLGVDPRAPRFLGDLPHAWVHSDFARTALDLFAFERDGSLILAAGVPSAWLTQAGVEVSGLPTPWGPLSYSLRQDGAALVLQWSLAELPLGGLRLWWPYPVAERVPGPPRGRGAARRWLGSPPELLLTARAGRVVLPWRAPARADVSPSSSPGSPGSPGSPASPSSPLLTPLPRSPAIGEDTPTASPNQRARARRS